MREEILRMERVTLRSEGEEQLDNFSLSVMRGEILGLIPANNYGIKSLVNILQNNPPLHYGYVYYRERLVNSWNQPRHGTNRISFIGNRDSLADKLTIADNIFVLRHGFKKRVIHPSVLEKQLQPFLDDIHVTIRAEAGVDSLTHFERLVVELLKAVVAGNWLIVMEDASTLVSSGELERLHEILVHYAKQGFSFIYIEPHYEEMQKICDRIALMDNGQIIKIVSVDQNMPQTLVTRETISYEQAVRKNLLRITDRQKKKEKILDVCRLTQNTIHHLDFSVNRGECLAVQDVDNIIMTDLIKILDGEERIQQGGIYIEGTEVCYGNDRRIAVIQEIPVESMIFDKLSYLDNLCFCLDHRMNHIWRSNKVKKSIRKEMGAFLGEDVFDKQINELTQEERYALVYMRIYLQRPKVVFCINPFKMAGVSLRMYILKLMQTLLDKDISVVILSINLSDSIAIADRLLRVRKDEPPREYSREEFKNLPGTTPWRHIYCDDIKQV